MERVMVKTARNRDQFAERNPQPERWAFASREIVNRASEARAQALRKFFAWLACQTVALAKRWTEAYRASRARRAAIRELQSLDNRTLRDIGIGRSEIEWRVAGGDESRVTQRPAAMGSKPCADASARRNHRHGAEKRAA
jgi:uncharacterized protein YjiS (DUF1127 family)